MDETRILERSRVAPRRAILDSVTCRRPVSSRIWHITRDHHELRERPRGVLMLSFKQYVPTLTIFGQCHLHSVSASPLQDTITLVLPKQLSIQPIHLLYAVKGADVTRCQPGARTPSLNTTIQLEYPQRIDGCVCRVLTSSNLRVSSTGPSCTSRS